MNPVELNDLLNEAAGGEPAPAQEPEGTPTEPTVQTETGEPAPAQEPEGTPTEPNNEGTPTPTENTGSENNEPPSEPKPKSNPMKEVRDQLKAEQKAKERIESAIQRLSDGDYDFKLKDFKTENGKVDYDALITAMDNADTKKKAEERGITPELQAEIDRIEREKLEVQKERLKATMDRAISDLQVDKNLDRASVNQFFADALAVKKNPYQWIAQGGTLEDLYYLIYRDTLIKSAVEKAVAEEKQKWEAQNSKMAPTSNPAKPATSKSGDDSLSLSQLLNEALNKK